MKVAVLTISDGVNQGTREDRSGPEIIRFCERHGDTIASRGTVPDEAEAITRWLLEACDRSDAELVITTGGTGFAPRDVTPEATRVILERETPGLSEAMRIASLEKTPMAALSRAVSGIRGTTLILNLPGSPKAVIECLDAVHRAVLHGVDLLQDRSSGHPTGPVETP